MKLVLCLIVFTSAFAGIAQNGDTSQTAQTSVETPAHFKRAEDFAGMSEVDRMVYSSGLLDGFYASGLFGAQKDAINVLKICTKDMDNKQIAAIVLKHVKDHPEHWHWPLSVEAYNALSAACPGGLKSLS
jgi:hypothetical protein